LSAVDATDPIDDMRLAAAHAVTLVRSGMVLGLGSGRTASFALEALASRLKRGELSDIRGVPCSSQTADEARRLGVPLVALEGGTRIDLTIDGADEVDPALELIKGGGGALLREKIVAQASAREVIVVDERKLSPRLGTHRALPVEVVAFGFRRQMSFLEELGAASRRVTLRLTPLGEPYQTDEGHLILDCAFGPIEDLGGLARALEARAGIVGHGLFLDLATDLIVAGPSGIRHLRRGGQAEEGER
jgi:ribose 5-phosphate isomerase A